ncbi:MAG: hypothetical protein Q8K63_10205 [Acidimicrobiales bacterium]|nr:hypothetical protein [Acidimicrobiales bacterium]
MRRIAFALLALALGMSLVPLVASVSNADGLDGLVTGEAESYALRIEYDIPLPAGPGDIPHTIGEIRRTTAGENAKGLAAAPTHLGAVVIGQYVNPNKLFDDPADYNYPPQAECFYPGDLVDVEFAFPTDTRTETEAVPPVGTARAQCGAGPITDLRGTVEYFDSPGVSARNLESTSLMRTAEGVDRADTSAHASDISIAGGAVKIGGVGISGTSSVTGKKGGNATSTRITIDDIEIAGLTFSIADDRLIVAGQEVPLLGNVAQATIEQANALLIGSGCRVDVVTNPARYPQGYLFSRPAPKVGLAEDGTFAASMRAGLLVLCDLPESVTPKNLTPQRVQVVVGFAYTAASATADPGGFGIGNLGGSGDSEAGSPLGAIGSITTPLAPIGDVVTAPTETTTKGGDDKQVVAIAKPALPIAVIPLDGATRLTLIVLCAIAWALLTHFGLTRLRHNP